jgi:hypothetical protein
MKHGNTGMQVSHVWDGLTDFRSLCPCNTGPDAGTDADLEYGALEGTIDEVLDAGVERLKERTTWKLWTWPGEETEFTDAEAFRSFVTDKNIREELRKYLPRDDPKTPERPAEEAFRKRM